MVESAEMVERHGAAMLRALADEDALRVFAQVVAATGTGLPERSGGSISIHYVTAHGVSRQTGLPVSAVLCALKRLTDARLTIEKEDGGGWRTDFEALCRAADPQVGDRSLALPVR
jgi:DNA-binding transcriptional ArsR family regulator